MRLMIYLIMFSTAFFSATLLPMGSEAVLIYNIIEGYDLILLFLMAVFGNTLGSYVNYFLGFKGEEYLIRKNILKMKRLLKYKDYFDKFGGIVLLFSWLPVIGDGFTLVAGVLRFNIVKFFLYVFMAKFLRYLILIILYYNFEQEILEYLNL